MKILFDLRDHPEDPSVRAANKALASDRPEYIRRYGAIASDRWWRRYNAGRICRTYHAGQIVHIGEAKDFVGEVNDIVRVRTDRSDDEYERAGFWLDAAVVLGKWVHVESIKSIVWTRTGPVIHIVTVRVWLDGKLDRLKPLSFNQPPFLVPPS